MIKHLYTLTLLFILSAATYNGEEGPNYNNSRTIADSTKPINSVRITTKGEYLLTGSDDNKVRLYKYNGASLELNQTLSDSNTPIRTSIMPNNYSLLITLSASTPSQIRFYQASTENKNTKMVLIQTMIGSGDIVSIGLSENANTLVAVSSISLVTIYRFNSISNNYSFFQSISLAESIKFNCMKVSSDGFFFAVGGQDGIYVYKWNFQSKKYQLDQAITTPGAIRWIQVANTTQKDMIIITGSNILSIYGLNLTNNQFQLKQNIQQIRNSKSIALSADGRFIITSNNTNIAQIIMFTEGFYRIISSISEKVPINTVSLSSSSTFMVVGKQDGTVTSYFQCLKKYCSECLWVNQCQNCYKGFELYKDDICICRSGRTISSNGECVECGIQACNRCDQPKVCSECDSIWVWDKQTSECNIGSSGVLVVIGESIALILIVVCCVYGFGRQKSHKKIKSQEKPLIH